MTTLSIRRSGAALGVTVLAAATLFGTAHAKPAEPTGIDRVDFAAAHHTTYSHWTGGGNYGDGSNAYVREELESTDFQCYDIVSYFLKFEGNGGGGAVTTSWVIEFDYATTGQDGVALVPMISPWHLLLNTDDSQYNDPDGDAVLSAAVDTLVKESPSKAVEKYSSGITQVTFDVSGVNPGDFIVVRLDARIECDYPSTPTGNLLVKAASGSIGNSAINVGEQTVPLKVRGDFTQNPPS
ncbi:MAG: hypothetical protein Q7V57_12180 [Actinomycetota bacterium]|nr:hypothetical protein [Actinomycetota bacterium]